MSNTNGIFENGKAGFIIEGEGVILILFYETTIIDMCRSYKLGFLAHEYKNTPVGYGSSWKYFTPPSFFHELQLRFELQHWLGLETPKIKVKEKLVGILVCFLSLSKMNLANFSIPGNSLLISGVAADSHYCHSFIQI